MHNEIVLITRVRTLNKGNQALSAAWVDMARRAFPDARVRLLERRPHHLLQYTVRQLAAQPDPVVAFEVLARRLARMAPGAEHAEPISESAAILLDETTRPPARFAALRQRANLRGRLAAIGRYAADYRVRLAACQRARLVIVNPAGEFFPREPLAAYYHVLDAYVSHKLGTPTAIVNHTMDIDDPVLSQIIPYVYRQLALVGFRDDKSVPAFQAMGGDLDNVIVTPDLALTTELAAGSGPRPNKVAVAINVPEAEARGYLARWHDVIEALLAVGLEVELVSNELPADQSFYESIRRRHPNVTIAGAGLDHDRYGALLGTYELVITSRMHTGILAMVAGRPVLPVEGASFKMTGLFQELALAQSVIRPSGDRWTDLVIAETHKLRADGGAAARARTQVRAARDRIVSTLVPRLRAAATQEEP